MTSQLKKNTSIGFNTLLNKLPDFNAMIPADFTVPQSDVLDSVVRFDSNIIWSNHSNISDDLSECESLNEYRK